MLGDQKGYTLIEIIFSMLLVGIMAAVITSGVVYMAESFVFSQENTDALNRAQLAMARLTKEFQGLKWVYSDETSDKALKYDTGRSEDPDDIETATVAWSGTAGEPLMYTLHTAGGDVTTVLVDQVKSFSFRYYDQYNGGASTSWSSARRIVEVQLVVTAADNADKTFVTRKTLINLYP